MNMLMGQLSTLQVSLKKQHADNVDLKLRLEQKDSERTELQKTVDSLTRKNDWQLEENMNLAKRLEIGNVPNTDCAQEIQGTLPQLQSLRYEIANLCRHVSDQSAQHNGTIHWKKQVSLPTAGLFRSTQPS